LVQSSISETLCERLARYRRASMSQRTAGKSESIRAVGKVERRKDAAGNILSRRRYAPLFPHTMRRINIATGGSFSSTLSPFDTRRNWDPPRQIRRGCSLRMVQCRLQRIVTFPSRVDGLNLRRRVLPRATTGSRGRTTGFPGEFALPTTLFFSSRDRQFQPEIAVGSITLSLTEINNTSRRTNSFVRRVTFLRISHNDSPSPYQHQ